MVPVVGAVRGVQVDRDVRVVLGEQADQRARLGRLQLHVVAIEIEALGVRPLPHARHGA